MKRGDLITIALQGEYGKPRPALVVQSNTLSDLESVIVCPLTSKLRDCDFRVPLEPSASNNLSRTSLVMVDKIVAIPLTKTGNVFGSVDARKMMEVDRALLLVIGLA